MFKVQHSGLQINDFPNSPVFRLGVSVAMNPNVVQVVNQFPSRPPSSLVLSKKRILIILQFEETGRKRELGGSVQDNRMNVILMTNSPFCTAPNGADWVLSAPFPTLKRGANHHCASGAIETRSSLTCNFDSCDRLDILSNAASSLVGGRRP
jgi:hypothetical protein